MATSAENLFKKHTIEISKKDNKCEVKENEKRVKAGDLVRWRGKQTVACVVFEEDQWPFENSFVDRISVQENQHSDEFKVKDPAGAVFEANYDFQCRSCDDYIPGGAGGAKIIIDP